MKNDHHVTIVGGGLVGPLAAIMMARLGYRVDVFERRPDLRKARISGGRSINLALADRGLYALHEAGLLDRIQPLLIPMRGRMIHPLSGDSEFAAYGQRQNEVIYSISRNRLNQVLLEAADELPEIRLHFEQTCQGVDWPRRMLTFQRNQESDRSEVEFDKLLGTDGANSAVRQAVVEAAGGSSRIEMLDHDYKELTIPAGPNGAHLLEREALHIWPRRGFMLIALPNLDGSFTVTLFLNKQGNPSFATLSDSASVATFFAEYFPDASEMIPSLTKDFLENPTGNLTTVHCSHWGCHGCALLLGDAAHGIVPFHGQGMNAGFEDCREWSHFLAATGHQWEQAIEQFTQWRIPQAEAIAAMALENYITMRDSVLDERFQLKREIGFELERRFPTRFVPRYSQIMFHPEIPYDDARRRGEIQDRLLDQLTESIQHAEQVDWEQAAWLVLSQLSEFESLTR